VISRSFVFQIGARALTTPPNDETARRRVVSSYFLLLQLPKSLNNLHPSDLKARAISQCLSHYSFSHLPILLVSSLSQETTLTTRSWVVERYRSKVFNWRVSPLIPHNFLFGVYLKQATRLDERTV
jgi:hypothetical protein